MKKSAILLSGTGDLCCPRCLPERDIISDSVHILKLFQSSSLVICRDIYGCVSGSLSYGVRGSTSSSSVLLSKSLSSVSSILLSVGDSIKAFMVSDTH